MNVGDRIISHNGVTFADKSSEAISEQLRSPCTEVVLLIAPLSTPALDPANTRTVMLARSPQKSLGFSIVGGVDTPARNVYLNHIFDNSPATTAGLKAGDQLIAVNDVPLEGLTHQQVIEVLETAGDSLRLKICNVPNDAYNDIYSKAAIKALSANASTMTAPNTSVIPNATSSIGFQSLPSRTIQRVPLVSDSHEFTEGPIEDVVVVRAGEGFGMSLVGGSDTSLGGLFVNSVSATSPNSAVLRVGDRILAVNGSNVMNLTRREILPLAGSAPSMTMTVMHVDPELYRRMYERAEALEMRHLDTLGTSAINPAQHTSAEASALAVSRVALFPNSDEYTEGALEEINLVRGVDGYGFAVLGGTDTGYGGVFVKFIAPGSVAERSRQLLVGDRVLSANDTSFLSSTYMEVLKSFREATSLRLVVMHLTPDKFQAILARGEQLEKSISIKQIIIEKHKQNNKHFQPKLN